MSSKIITLNYKQTVFKDIFAGTLIYAVMLGFFNDYTSIVAAESFSTIFCAAIVLEVLTYLAFLLKARIIASLVHRQGMKFRVLMFFSVWLVLFLSKFVFVGVVDMIFGNAINIYGFFGILLIVLSATITQKLSDIIFTKLGDA